MSLIDDTRGEGAVADEVRFGSVGDYVELLKPRVMSLVVFTALVGMVLAPGALHPVLAAVALLCIAIGAGASGALNMWYDADIDAKMTRTARRPVPSGRVDAEEAAAFGVVLSVGSVVLLGLAVNWLSAALLAFTIFFYAVVYTMWLKRSTPQNIVIGGAAGAFPPVIGWTAVTGTVSVEALALFLIIFVWTPPHFWALALYRSGDYERAGIPMMPNVAGRESTVRQILIYSAILAPLALSPALLGFAGWLYASVASVLSVLFLLLAWRLHRAAGTEREGEAAKQLFAFSVLHLFLIFALLLIERALNMAPLPGLVGA